MFSAIFTLIALVVAFGTTTPAMAQSDDFPSGFCFNSDGRVFNPDNPLPEDEPCDDASYDVVNGENPVGTFNDGVESGLNWEQVLEYTSGIVWANGGSTSTGTTNTGTSNDPAANPTATPRPRATAQPAQAKGCMAESTRDERLICLDEIYDSQGFNAWAAAFGEMQVVVEARQPDEYHPAGHPETVRGHQVDGTGTLPDPRSCVTTDVPARVTSYGVKYQIPGAGAALYGGSVSFSGDVSIWPDCTDWPQFADLLTDEPGAATGGGSDASETTPMPSESNATVAIGYFPDGWCQNTDGRKFDPENPLLENGPCGDAEVLYDVVSCETSEGEFSTEATTFDSYSEARDDCLSGIIWAGRVPEAEEGEADADGDGGEPSDGFPPWATVVIVIVGILVVGYIGYIVGGERRDDADGDGDDDDDDDVVVEVEDVDEIDVEIEDVNEE